MELTGEKGSLGRELEKKRSDLYETDFFLLGYLKVKIKAPLLFSIMF